jgi:hypothetical protein
MAAACKGAFDRIILVYFVACGVSRLARYNVTAEELSGGTGKVKYFEGTPIPTSIFLVALLSLAAWNGSIGPNLWFGEVWIAGFPAPPSGAGLCAVGIADDQPHPHPPSCKLKAAGRTPPAALTDRISSGRHLSRTCCLRRRCRP